jgi:hypothetical protein
MGSTVKAVVGSVGGVLGVAALVGLVGLYLRERAAAAASKRDAALFTPTPFSALQTTRPAHQRKFSLGSALLFVRRPPRPARRLPSPRATSSIPLPLGPVVDVVSERSRPLRRCSRPGALVGLRRVLSLSHRDPHDWQFDVVRLGVDYRPKSAALVAATDHRRRCPRG